jgi:hypothetical protein
VAVTLQQTCQFTPSPPLLLQQLRQFPQHSPLTAFVEAEMVIDPRQSMRRIEQ